MNYRDRIFYAMQYFHGILDAATQSLRAMTIAALDPAKWFRFGGATGTDTGSVTEAIGSTRGSDVEFTGMADLEAW